MLVITDRRGIQDKHVTFPDVVKFGAPTAIEMITILAVNIPTLVEKIDIQTGQILTELYWEDVRIYRRKQEGFWWVVLNTGKF